jgi:hydrogenase maturation protease
MTPPVTVVAIGNPYRSDDGAGAAVLARLAALLGEEPRVRLVELDGEPVRMVQSWEGSTAVWIIDCVRSGRPPGSIHEVDAARLGELDDRGARLGGGHLLGLADAVELARVIGALPPELRVVGIEGECFDFGVGLTEVVDQACSQAASNLAASIRAHPTLATVNKCGGGAHRGACR